MNMSKPVHTIAYLVGVLSPFIILRPKVVEMLNRDPNPNTRSSNGTRFTILLVLLTVMLHYIFMRLKTQNDYYQAGAAALVLWVSMNHAGDVLKMLFKIGFFEMTRYEVGFNKDGHDDEDYEEW